jgi:sulfoxide reductase heme-binding subunit YedZ
MQAVAGSSNRPLGTNGDPWRRLLIHHVPLALASALGLTLFVSSPPFDVRAHPHADIFSGPWPQTRSAGDTMDHRMGHTMDDGRRHTGRIGHGEDETGPMGHAGHTGPMRHGGDQGASIAESGDEARPGSDRSFVRQLTLGSGYVALGLLAVTLLIGPANLLLGRRTPISNYLSRDVGTWAAIASVGHTLFALQVHGTGRVRDFLVFFVAPDGRPLLNSFGLGNWTGLAAVAIVMGLLAISNDATLGKLKARNWKRLQRLNYALFALVILHAFFYGALVRVTSPFTLVLGLSVATVVVGQIAGVYLWRRRNAHHAPIGA